MTRIADSTGSPHARILGVGGYRPSRVISNAEICQLIDSTDEWIQTRSGIINRRWADDDETVQMMGVAAARAALEHANVAAEEVGCVIVGTVSHLLQTPAVATLIADELLIQPGRHFNRLTI